MVLRPYQFYAVEALVERVKSSTKNGYIWHTTGSGKTLTSFKASQILMNLPQVHKIVFVVDRKDLDYQTTKEFNGVDEVLLLIFYCSLFFLILYQNHFLLICLAQCDIFQILYQPMIMLPHGKFFQNLLKLLLR